MPRVRGIAFFFGVAFIIEVLIILHSASTSASVSAAYIGKSLALRRHPHPAAACWWRSRSRWR